MGFFVKVMISYLDPNFHCWDTKFLISGLYAWKCCFQKILNVFSNKISVYQSEIRNNLQTPLLDIDILIINTIQNPFYDMISCHLFLELIFVEF